MVLIIWVFMCFCTIWNSTDSFCLSENFLPSILEKDSLQPNQFSWKIVLSSIFCNCQKCHLPFLSTDVSKNHHIRVKIFARCCKMCWRDKIPILFLVCLDTQTSRESSSRAVDAIIAKQLVLNSLIPFYLCVKIWRKKAAALPYSRGPLLWKTASWGMQHNCLLMPL